MKFEYQRKLRVKNLFTKIRERNYLKVSGTNKVNNLKDLPTKERLRGSRT